MTAFSERLQGRLDRLGIEFEDLAVTAGLSVEFARRLLDGTAPMPKGKKLLRLADALSTSVAYLVGLDPDAPVPEEYLQEDQGALGLLAADEERLLRAYRRLDVPSRAALLQIVGKMSPEPEALERKPRQQSSRHD